VAQVTSASALQRGALLSSSGHYVKPGHPTPTTRVPRSRPQSILYISTTRHRREVRSLHRPQRRKRKEQSPSRFLLPKEVGSRSLLRRALAGSLKPPQRIVVSQSFSRNIRRFGSMGTSRDPRPTGRPRRASRSAWHGACACVRRRAARVREERRAMALRGYRPARWSKFIPDSGVMALIEVPVRAERAWVNVLVRRSSAASARKYIPNGGRECADPLGVATRYRHEGDALGADGA
jgi:hypothetical protein